MIKFTDLQVGNKYETTDSKIIECIKLENEFGEFATFKILEVKKPRYFMESGFIGHTFGWVDLECEKYIINEIK